MSVIQGTMQLIDNTFTDPDTKLPFDPPDVIATIKQPGALTVTQLHFSLGEMQKLAVGKYRYSVDTTPASGEWELETACTGPLAIVKRRTLRVRPALS